MWMNGPWMNGPWNWFPWIMLFPLIFLTFLIVILIFMFRGGGPMCGNRGVQPGAQPKERSAREILDQRYARGEINQQEYQQMRKDIE